MLGPALWFDTTAQYADSLCQTASAGEWTYAAILRINSPQPISAVISGSTNTSGQIGFGVKSDGRAFLNKYGTGDVATSSFGHVYANCTHVVAVRRSGTAHTFFIDGKFAGTTTIAGDFTATTTRIGRLGSYSNAQMDGYLHALCYWTRALSDAEMAAWAADPLGMFRPSTVRVASLGPTVVEVSVSTSFDSVAGFSGVFDRSASGEASFTAASVCGNVKTPVAESAIELAAAAECNVPISVTQQFADVALTSGGKLRTTQQFVEVALASRGTLRTTQQFAEVLVSDWVYGHGTVALSPSVEIASTWIHNLTAATLIELAAVTRQPNVGGHAVSSMELTSASRACQTYTVAAGASLSLNVSCAASGAIYSDAISTLTLDCLADNRVFARTCVAILALATDAGYEASHTAANRLDLFSQAVRGLTRTQVTNTLALTASARSNPQKRSTASVIVFSASIQTNVHLLDASSVLSFTSEVLPRSPLHANAVAAISSVEYVYNPVTFRVEPVYAGLVATATVAKTQAELTTRHYLQLQAHANGVVIRANAIQCDASVGITFETNPAPTKLGGATEWLWLGAIASSDVSKPAVSSLELDALAIARCTRGRSLGVALSLANALLFTESGGDYVRQYHPFIGSGVSGLPTPPAATLAGPLAGVDSAFMLVSPATGAATDSITLRAPTFGNTDRLGFNRVLRETRGGTRLVYADAIWPKTQTLAMTFTALRSSEVTGLREFLRDHVGEEIGLLDWEHRYWRGVITTPDAQAIADSPGGYAVSLEFEGELDPSWEPV
jgi:hypothetical protein